MVMNIGPIRPGSRIVVSLGILPVRRSSGLQAQLQHHDAGGRNEKTASWEIMNTVLIWVTSSVEPPTGFEPVTFSSRYSKNRTLLASPIYSR